MDLHTQLVFTSEHFNAPIAIELFEMAMQEMKKENHYIKTMRWDGEGAIWGTIFDKWSKKNNIQRIRSASGEQNLAEMKIKVLRQRAQKMCEEARMLPLHFEHILYRHAAHLTNLLPSEPLMGRAPCQEYMELSPADRLRINILVSTCSNRLRMTF